MTHKANPKISIIIPTFNGKKYILDCLKSIEKSTYSDYEVIVIDNASKDGTPELVKEEFPQIELIVNKKNLGFTGGNNIGIKESRGEFIFLLNDDTVIHPDLLKTLVTELESSPKIGIVGPKIYFIPASSADKPARQDKIWFAGGKIDWKRGEAYNLGRGLINSELKNDIRKEVDFITGCALMVKREVIEKIGLLDEKFFAYYEDADWCQKAAKAGYSVVYIPFGGVWHVKSATSSQVYLDDIRGKYFRMLGRYLFTVIRLKYKNYRNRLVFFIRHAKFYYKIIFLIRFIFIFTPKFLGSVLIVTPYSVLKNIGRRIKSIFEF